MGNIPVKYIGYGVIGVLAICFIIFIWSLILCILKVKNTKFEGKKNTVIISLGCIAVALASWVLNIGWLRFVMTLLFVPLTYCAIFFTVNTIAAKYSKCSAILKWCNLIYVATFILANLLYPDVSGTVNGVGETYFLFGLVRNPSYIIAIQNVADVILIIHAVLFVVQLVLVGMAKNTDDAPMAEEVTKTTIEEPEEKENQEDDETTEEVTE